MAVGAFFSPPPCFTAVRQSAEKKNVQPKETRLWHIGGLSAKLPPKWRSGMAGKVAGSVGDAGKLEICKGVWTMTIDESCFSVQ